MNIIELAREAGIDVDTAWGVADTAIERFAALVRAQTLEEAAVVIEDWDTDSLDPRDGAAAIRALAKEKT